MKITLAMKLDGDGLAINKLFEQLVMVLFSK
jgi:hypothetical protein